MPDPAGTPLHYGRQNPTPPPLRWLILLIVWTVGVAIWVVYFLLITYLLTRILL